MTTTTQRQLVWETRINHHASGCMICRADEECSVWEYLINAYTHALPVSSAEAATERIIAWSKRGDEE